MPVRGLREAAPDPRELFTGRAEELARFQRCLDAKPGDPLPILMFYGVAGAGKSSILNRLRDLARETGLPVARLDFDVNQDGGAYHQDQAACLAQIRAQWNISCPRFELAYAMLLHKQGIRDQPTARHGAVGQTAWELTGELANAGLSDIKNIPGANLIVWFSKKIGDKAFSALRDTPMGKWLATKAGNEDLLALLAMTDQEIRPTLRERLARDLSVQLSRRDGKLCRVVLFLDTFEHLRRGGLSDAQQWERERWIGDLWAALHEETEREGWLPFVQIVVGGRDRLTWDQHDADYAQPACLEQHLVGGLSHGDAITLLGKSKVVEGPLQRAILELCLDTEDTGGATPQSPKPGYHAYKLALCADTVREERSRGLEVTPASFRLSSGGFADLVQRFLLSLGDDAYANQVRRLAWTPRFDEAAAQANFPGDVEANRHHWQQLWRYSFVESAGEGWSKIHAQMRDCLLFEPSITTEVSADRHVFWEEHWSSRQINSRDEFAGLAWFHTYVSNPQEALQQWTEQAESARRELRMVDHLALLSWWTPTGLERERNLDALKAIALNALGVEVCQASLGQRGENVLRGIACYKAALHVFTEASFPQLWATTQHYLGTAYSELPSGDRVENLEKAITHYKAALRVHTEADFPLKWALTQNNLGNTYRNLPSGDREENLKRAIACLEAALRIYTEADFLAEWAMIQINLGNAYSELPSGDRVENLEKAIAYYKAALQVYTEADFPLEWALTQNNLGAAYWNLPIGDRERNIAQAIDFHEAALRVYTEAHFPQQWAMAQTNLGTAHSNLPSGDRGENLERAIDYYKAALRVYTEAHFPQQWALTQNNLGTAHRNLLSGDRGENLKRAIACFEAALRVHTEAHFPQQWAMAKNNLGNAYRDLPSGDREENLERAITCLEAALRVFTEADFPQEWAMAQCNIGIASAELGNQAAALFAVERAVRMFRFIGHSHYASRAEALLQRLREVGVE